MPLIKTVLMSSSMGKKHNESLFFFLSQTVIISPFMCRDAYAALLPRLIAVVPEKGKACRRFMHGVRVHTVREGCSRFLCQTDESF